jgi:hypothetical protein
VLVVASDSEGGGFQTQTGKSDAQLISTQYDFQVMIIFGVLHYPTYLVCSQTSAYINFSHAEVTPQKLLNKLYYMM